MTRRPRADRLTDPVNHSRSNLAVALALLSRWRLSEPFFPRWLSGSSPKTELW
jgi:hypothetical protein